MFERFTERARRAVFFARYESSVLGWASIEPEHLLLGVFRDPLELREHFPQDMIAQLLSAARRRRSESAIPLTADIPISSALRRVFIRAAEQAEKLGSKNIEVGHLLLGLLLEPSPASDLLREFPIAEEQILKTLSPTKIPLQGRTIRPQDAVEQLRRIFAPLTVRLTHETEPALFFTLSEKR